MKLDFMIVEAQKRAQELHVPLAAFVTDSRMADSGYGGNVPTCWTVAVN